MACRILEDDVQTVNDSGTRSTKGGGQVVKRNFGFDGKFLGFEL